MWQISYESSISHTFCCRPLRAVSPLPPYPTSCLCCRPMPLYGNCGQPISTEQAAHSNCQCERREGWELQTEMNRNRPVQKQYTPPAHTHSLPRRFKTKARCHNTTTKPSDTCKLYSAANSGATGCMLQRCTELVFWWQMGKGGLGYYAEERR